MMDDWEFSGCDCPKCGDHMRTNSCDQCFGLGHHDLHAEDPINERPGAIEGCRACAGTGSNLWCHTCSWDDRMQFYHNGGPS